MPGSWGIFVETTDHYYLPSGGGRAVINAAFAPLITMMMSSSAHNSGYLLTFSRIAAFPRPSTIEQQLLSGIRFTIESSHGQQQVAGGSFHRNNPLGSCQGADLGARPARSSAMLTTGSAYSTACSSVMSSTLLAEP